VRGNQEAIPQRNILVTKPITNMATHMAALQTNRKASRYSATLENLFQNVLMGSIQKRAEAFFPINLKY
jgi:hypothetical protein